MGQVTSKKYFFLKSKTIFVCGEIETYTQTCVKQPPSSGIQKLLPLMRSLFEGSLYVIIKSSKWDFKMLVVIDKGSLFGGGR